MNKLEKFLLPIAPGFVKARLQSRADAYKFDAINRRFEGATEGRRGNGFNPVTGSPNKEIGKELRSLVKRSRDLFYNSPYNKRAVRSIANNVVGTGITPTPKSKQAKFVELIKEAWINWAEDTSCDYDGIYNFYGLEKLVSKTVEMYGSAIVLRRRVPVKSNPIGLQLQVLSPEYLDINKNEEGGEGAGYIQSGIEFSKEGKRTKYWIFNRHPSEGGNTSKPFNVSDVLLVFEGDEPGQALGYPASAVSMLKQRDLNDYEDAEIFGKKISATTAGFISNNDPDDASSNSDDYDDLGNIKAEPGSFYYLRPHEQITFSNPPLSANYEPFIRAHQRAIAAGHEVTYEILSNDYSQVNFSSGRMGNIEMQKSVEHKQVFVMIPMFCTPAYKWFLAAVQIAPKTGITTGMIPADLRVTWTTPRREMIDPASETTAENNQLESRTLSWQEAQRRKGYNPEEVFKELVEDHKRFKDAGIPTPWNDPKETAAKMATGNVPKNKSQKKIQQQNGQG